MIHIAGHESQHMALGNLVSFSGPHFSRVQQGDNNCSCFKSFEKGRIK